MGEDDSGQDSAGRVRPLGTPITRDPAKAKIIASLGTPIDRDEYEDWLSPADTIETLKASWDRDTAIGALLVRLSAGAVKSAAQFATFKPPNDRVVQHPYRIIGEGYWNPESAWVPISTFWQTGDIYFDLTDGEGYQQFSMGRISFLGVRFERSAVMAMISPPKAAVAAVADAPPGSTKRDLPRLPEALLQKWYALYREAYPMGSKALAEKSVEGMFPKHHVARDRVRELFPDASRGRPRKINDLDNSPERDGD